jgi:P4 family phage/plasmid primase-like protien
MDHDTSGKVLLPTHIEHLRTSGLTDETIETAGLYSVTDPGEGNQILNWKRGAKAPVPAIAFPYGKDYVRLRPDNPRKDREGKAIKYEAPKDHPSRIYIPERVNPSIRDLSVAVWMLEGEKKTLLHNQAGFAAVGAPGVWQFNDARIYREERKLELHADLNGIVTPGRQVIILFDRDIDTNEQIVKAAARIARLFTKAGAIVLIAYIPHDAQSKGCDDYFVELGSDVQEYRQRLQSTARPVDRNRLIGWLVENAPSWSAEQRDHEVRRALMLMARLLEPDEFTTWLPALSSRLNISEARLHALRGVLSENGWAIRAIKPGAPEREYVFDDAGTLPAGIEIPKDGWLASNSGAYLAQILIYEVGAPVAYSDGKPVIYRDGAFSDLNEDELHARIIGWDRRPIGEREKLHVGSRTIKDVISCFKDSLRHPSNQFFELAPLGIAFRNLFVQLVDGELVAVDHSPANRALRKIDGGADPNAACPAFDRFLHEVLTPQGGIQDQEEKIEAFWQWLGIALLGLATKYGKALILYGPGGTGKSTLLEIISVLWPAALRANFSIHALEDKFDRARLAGKQINICGELPAATAKSVEMVKAIITGRDDIEARHPYERGFSFRPKAAHVFAANNLPAVGDPSLAFYDRFIVLRMENRFRGTDQENRDLAKAIIQTELGSIGFKAMQAATRALAANRIVEPRSSTAAIEEWKGISDSVRAWFEECCEHSPVSEGVKGSEAYSYFRHWCETNGYSQISNGEFAGRLKAMGVSFKKTNEANIWHMAVNKV